MFALSAEADREALIVSVHDVAPTTRAAVEKILAELSRHRIPVCSLLVVPNYHHRGCFTEDRGFVRCSDLGRRDRDRDPWLFS